MATAAVFDGPGKSLRFETVPPPPLGPGEAWVRVRLCTLCGSDLHTHAGHRTEATPCVLGHEMVGEVEAVGPAGLNDVAGDPVRVGDRVVWAVAVSCGTCFFCTHDLPQKCESLFKYGKAQVEPGRGPFGGLATHCHLLQNTAVVKVPAGLPDEVAAPAMCAAATVVAALRAGGNPDSGSGRYSGPLAPRAVGPAPNRTVISDGKPEPLAERADHYNGHYPGSGGVVLVTGLGLLGLTACAMAATAGHRVLAVDRDAGRLQQAVEYGAAYPVELPGGESGLWDYLATQTPGRGADVALELSGAVPPTRLALSALRTGGTLVLVGAVSPTDAVPLHPEDIVRRCLTIRGVHNYAPRDLAAAVAWLAEHHTRFPFAGLVGKTFPLADADAAFRYATYERPVRVGVRP